VLEALRFSKDCCAGELVFPHGDRVSHPSETIQGQRSQNMGVEAITMPPERSFTPMARPDRTWADIGHMQLVTRHLWQGASLW
jgi:hypothetical protein